MSKYLVKILSICAFVILLPLIVVGSALCVTEAMGCTLTVVADGVESQFNGAGTSSTVSIYIEGQKQDSNKIVIKKNTDVTVTYEGVGYDFVGWYNGNYAEIKQDAKAESTDKSYSFTVRGSQVLTAVRNVQKYTVTYEGKMDDGETDIDVDPVTETVVYGQPLAELIPIGDKAFEGWYIVGGESVLPTKIANFGKSGTYTLNPMFGNHMTVEYYDGDTKIGSTDIVSEEETLSYALWNETNIADYMSENAKGYDFVGWEYDGNTITSLPEFKADGYKLYLKKAVKNYTVTVKFNAISDATGTIAYNVADGFGAYDTTRAGYNLLGLKYNDTLYTANEAKTEYTADGANLSQFVVANNGLNVTAVWECVYNYHFRINIEGQYEDNEGYRWTVIGDYGVDTDVFVEKENVSVNFVDANDEAAFDLQDDLVAYLTEGFTNTRDNEEGHASVTLPANAKLFINNEQVTRISNGKFTFLNLMTTLETLERLENLEGSTLQIAILYEAE